MICIIILNMNLHNNWNGNCLFWNNVDIVITDGHTTTNEWIPNHWWCRRIDDKIVFLYIVSRLRSIQTTQRFSGRRPGKSAASRLHGLSSRSPVRMMNRSLIGHALMTNAITCVGASVCALLPILSLSFCIFDLFMFFTFTLLYNQISFGIYCRGFGKQGYQCQSE